MAGHRQPAAPGAACREKGEGRRGADADLPEEIDTPKVHQSLLPGLLSHLGLKDAEKHEYLGARGAKLR